MSLMLAVALSAAAQAQPFPTRAGQCGWVHGRFRIANGSSIQRIWVFRTTHVVALYDSDEHYPASLRRLVASPSYKPLDTAIIGRFQVCARQRWVPGQLQHVRLKAADSLKLDQ